MPRPNGMHTMPKRTKSESRAVYRGHEALAKLKLDLHDGIRWRNHIPAEWPDLHRNHNREKVKITTRIDVDVLKYIRSLGPGYQDRLNAVLRAWVEAKAAAMIRDEAHMTEKLDREAQELGRPIWAGPSGTWEDPNATLD